MGGLRNALRSDRVERLTAGFIAVFVVWMGVQPLLRGDLFYKNYWGGLVLGPLAIGIGLFALYLVLFRWARWRSRVSQRLQLKGRAARKARQAEAHREPIDDFDKPWGGGV